MTFEMELTATTKDPGGLVGSFQAQLDEFGGTSELLSETAPVRVDSGSTFYFQVVRTYRITL